MAQLCIAGSDWMFRQSPWSFSTPAARLRSSEECWFFASHIVGTPLANLTAAYSLGSRDDVLQRTCVFVVGTYIMALLTFETHIKPPSFAQVERSPGLFRAEAG